MVQFISKDLKYKYEAYGLKIHSEIFLPELISLESEKPDVVIYCSDGDLKPQTVIHEGISFKVTPNSIYRHWDAVGRFKINRNSIIINPTKDVGADVFRNFLLGTVFATLLRLRGFFVFHASSVNINGSAVAFSGFKGYGKSTTALALYNEGYPIVADDYISVEFDQNIPITTPGFPNLRLSPNSKNLIGINNNDSNLIEKTYFPVLKSFSNKKIPLKKIYLLQRGEFSKISELTPRDAFMEIVKNTFGIHMFNKMELPENFFMCYKIVKNVDISILEIPDSIEKIKEVVDLVKEDNGEV